MNESHPSPSHLFTVRVWQEKLSEEIVEIRFQTKHLLSGERCVFREGEQLLRYLVAKVEEGGEVDEVP